MKKISIILAISIFPTILFAQSVSNELLEEVDYTSLKSNVFLNKGFKLDEINEFRNINHEFITDSYQWKNIYKQVNQSLINNDNLPLYNDLLKYNDAKKFEPSKVAIAYLHYSTAYFTERQLLKRDFSNPNHFELFASGTLIHEVYNSTVRFFISPKLLFTNSENTINSVLIDFGNGKGYTKFDFDEQIIEVEYDCIGQKNIISKICTTIDTIVSFTSINVKTLKRKKPSEIELNNLTKMLKSSNISDIDYDIWLGDDNVLDKPFIIVEGFDFLNEEDKQEIFDRYNNVDIGSGNTSIDFIDNLQAHDYDIVVVNWNEPRNSLHDSKEALIAFISLINNQKIGNFESILLGESMGGVVCRMALKEMENNNIDHQVGLYISYDAPHKGANIQMGFQKVLSDAMDITLVEARDDFLTYLIPVVRILALSINIAINNSDVDPEDVLNGLNSTAAKQMIIRHHKGSQTYNTFQTYLTNLGYPTNCRNISLINGSDEGENFPFEPGDKFLDEQWGFCLFYKHKVKVYMSGINTTNQKVSWIRIWGYPLCIKYTDKEAKWSFDDKPYDNCPGGYQSTIDASSEGIDEFSFIPTVSSIDLDQFTINNEGLGYYNVNNGITPDFLINNNLTPFSDVYSQGDNTEHIYDIDHWSIENLIEVIDEQEIMYDALYLQNKTIEDDRSFEADDRIFIGNNVNSTAFPDKNIENGDFIIKNGANLSLNTGQSISFKPGFKIEAGATLSASTGTSIKKSAISHQPYVPKPKIIEKLDNIRNKIYLPFKKKKESYNYKWALSGDEYYYEYTGFSIELPSKLESGQYTLSCEIEKNGYSKKRTIAIQVCPNDPVESNDNKSEFFSFESKPKFNKYIQTKKIYAYPNPVKKNLNIMFFVNKGSNVKITIRNIMGQEMLSFHHDDECSYGLNQVSINIAHLKSGIYILNVYKDGNMATEKIIKE